MCAWYKPKFEIVPFAQKEEGCNQFREKWSNQKGKGKTVKPSPPPWWQNGDVCPAWCFMARTAGILVGPREEAYQDRTQWHEQARLTESFNEKRDAAIQWESISSDALYPKGAKLQKREQYDCYLGVGERNTGVTLGRFTGICGRTRLANYTVLKEREREAIGAIADYNQTVAYLSPCEDAWGTWWYTSAPSPQTSLYEGGSSRRPYEGDSQ